MPQDGNNVKQEKQHLIDRVRGHRAYPVAYMFAVTFFFTLILVGISTATRERVEANRRIMRERALLMAALPDTVDRETPSVQVSEIFNRRIKPPPEPEESPLYQVMDEGQEEIIAYALPLEGQGFWDTIGGFLALEPDQRTITGIAFHEQNETPGLGAEIRSDDFRQQFSGKKLAEEEKPLRIISEVEERDEHSVHAITGATQTSNRLEDIINANVQAWRRSDMAGREEER